MRATLSCVMRRVGFAAALLTTSALVASGQIPNASPAAFAMGGNYTALARGYEAVAWNPANLAMPGRPFLSLGTGIVGGTVGMDPVDFTMLHGFSGQIVDSATRVSWIDLVKASGRQRARIDGGVTPLALSVGPVGFQIGASLYTNVDLSADAFEAVMFGNAGNNGGQAKTLDLAGTGISMGVIGGAAMSFAFPLPIKLSAGILANEHAAIGITGKYVFGNALIIAQDNGSSLGASSLQLDFPVIGPDSSYDGLLGVGTGADLSFAWSGGAWRVGILAENVFNSFKWDTTKLSYTAGTGFYNKDSSATNFDDLPYGSAPQALREKVAGQQFKPAINIGAAFKVTDFLTVTADMHQQMGGEDVITLGPKSRVGVGAELRIIPFIPLRAGVASVTDGWQAGAGFGVRLLGYELGVSGSIRRRGAANESGVMIGLVGFGH